MEQKLWNKTPDMDYVCLHMPAARLCAVASGRDDGAMGRRPRATVVVNGVLIVLVAVIVVLIRHPSTQPRLCQ